LEWPRGGTVAVGTAYGDFPVLIGDAAGVDFPVAAAVADVADVADVATAVNVAAEVAAEVAEVATNVADVAADPPAADSAARCCWINARNSMSPGKLTAFSSFGSCYSNG
jgi:hypothetical protein